MKRRVFISSSFFVTSAWAQIPPPSGAKAGADFLWYLSGDPRSRPNTFALSDNQQFLANAKAVQRLLQPLRPKLSPRVLLYHQGFLPTAEEKSIFGLEVQRQGSLFFEVYILGANKPPIIAGVKQMSFDEVLGSVAKKPLAIQQR